MKNFRAQNAGYQFGFIIGICFFVFSITVLLLKLWTLLFIGLVCFFVVTNVGIMILTRRESKQKTK